MPDPGSKRRDYYSLLGIPQNASADDVRRAFHQYARVYHPDNHVGASAEHRDEAEQAYRLATEAYRVLMDEEKRRLYDQGLAEGRTRYEADRTRERRQTSGGIEIGSPKARMFFAKARKAIQSGDLRQGKLNLQMALQNDPDNEGLKEALEALKEKMKK